jgi:periplasmic protein TonB
MSYQALLFCPDEKTARTVTQILSELEFNVEPCVETFAAVKKLMATHFDAVVVDCDNEQNAALLFKSARNSTSNQASLAVALVEGQAGVAKAFRIGANLVLTKPINIEQAKGTVRVARGLLRKGDPAKPGAPAQASTPVAAAPSKPAPPKPTAAKPTPTAKPAAPAVAATPAPKPAWPAHAAVASSAPVSSDSVPSDNDSLEINLDDDVPAPAEAPPAPPAIHRSPTKSAPAASAPATSLAAAMAKAKTAPKPVPPQVSPAAVSSGAASAPAPARETPAQATPTQETKPLDIAEATPAATTNPASDLDIPAEPVESARPAAEPPPPSFTFGGNAIESESSGSSKKILLIIAAVAIVAASAYAGWSYFQGRSSTPATPVSQPAKQPPLTANPAPSQPTAAASTPAPTDTAPTTTPAESATKSVAETPPPTEETAPAAISKKAINIAAASKPPQPDANETPAPAPLVVKGGTVHTSKPATEAAADAPAPSMIGIATPGAGAPPADLVGSGANGPAPVLQSVNISQGVSQGLLIKKVQPIYPKAALTMHIEGAVQLAATISKTGDIASVKVLSGDPRLAAAALEAVKQWKYKPYLLDGEPIQIQTTITLNFKAPN